MGASANYTGLVPVFVAAAVLMVLGASTSAIWPLIDTERLDRTTTVYWPEPQLMVEPDRDEGPVLITVTFTGAGEHAVVRAGHAAGAGLSPAHGRDAVEPLP